MAANIIPKESSPSVKLGMIAVSTVYPWTNPEDIDSLISNKLYKEVKDIKWIDKIQTSSSLGVSSIAITLKSNADTKDVLDEIRNNVNRVQLPADAKTPVITEIETNTNQAFSAYIYSTDPATSRSLLIARAIEVQKELEKLPGIESVTLTAQWLANASISTSQWGNDTTYDVDIIIPKEKLDSLGLSLFTIANSIRSINLDQPIGNFSLGEKNYDFRIEWKNATSFDFLDTPLSLPWGTSIRLGDIATIERNYKNDTINSVMDGTDWVAYTYVGITVNKTDNASIFAASDAAKEKILSMFSWEKFHGLSYLYSSDIADVIRDDYVDLFREALITLILVFFAMYLFVGFKDSLFATITLPLAFLSTFLILYYFWYSLNFLTNFSFILSFGIAVDTIIVIVQAASAKLRIWYSPRSAIMLALREYSIPIISWVSTTIVVFIPMMMLPGLMGKFLAYIPITIFWVLASWLVLALTVNSALYLLFVRERKTYIDNETVLEYASDTERELLLLEREGKEKISEWSAPLRTRVIHNVTEWYKRVLTNFLEHTYLRRASIVLPFFFFLFSIPVLAPIVWFELFPGDDNNITMFTIEWPVGIKTESMAKMVGDWTPYFVGYPEIEHVSSSLYGNSLNITVQLSKKKVRAENNQRSVFELEKEFLTKLSALESRGLKVVSNTPKNWPPWGKAIGIKLIAEDAKNLPVLIQTSKEFQNFLKTLPGTKNVGSTSKDTPGQFVLNLKKNLLANYNIPSSAIYTTLTQNMNGITVGTVEDNGEDMSVVVKTDMFLSGALMEDVLGLPFTLWPTTYRIGDFVDTRAQNAVAAIKREDGNVQITVDADLDIGVDTLATQTRLEEYAKNYLFPTGISFESWWENAANSELIVAVFTAFFLALMIIFAILTLQFNSFSQPAVILYSVIMSLPFVMIGLILTGNKFSLPFGIGFIAFTGIAVNHGIILISAINENLEKGMKGITALVEAGSSRLEPMTLTTLTTALGMLPIALKDRFWSGMGFTIIFGIIAASILTLFVVKGIYYELYVTEHEWLWNKMKRKFLKRRRG
jgi:multidrug efflux pump subunit AcrB